MNSQRSKQSKLLGKKYFHGRLTDVAYIYLNDEAERRGATAAKALSDILVEHKILRTRKTNTKSATNN